jgi:hypothetical protein
MMTYHGRRLENSILQRNVHSDLFVEFAIAGFCDWPIEAARTSMAWQDKYRSRERGFTSPDRR